MTELSHIDAQTHAMKDFRYPFRLKQSEQVPVILELKKYDNCPIFDNKSLFLNQKSHRAGCALKLQGFH